MIYYSHQCLVVVTANFHDQVVNADGKLGILHSLNLFDPLLNQYASVGCTINKHER